MFIGVFIFILGFILIPFSLISVNYIDGFPPEASFMSAGVGIFFLFYGQIHIHGSIKKAADSALMRFARSKDLVFRKISDRKETAEIAEFMREHYPWFCAPVEHMDISSLAEGKWQDYDIRALVARHYRSHGLKAGGNLRSTLFFVHRDGMRLPDISLRHMDYFQRYEGRDIDYYMSGEEFVKLREMLGDHKPLVNDADFLELDRGHVIAAHTLIEQFTGGDELEEKLKPLLGAGGIPGKPVLGLFEYRYASSGYDMTTFTRKLTPGLAEAIGRAAFSGVDMKGDYIIFFTGMSPLSDEGIDMAYESVKAITREIQAMDF